MTRLILTIERSEDGALLRKLAARLGIQVEEVGVEAMPDDEFWQLIDLVDLASSDSIDAIVRALSTRGSSSILAFQQTLAQKLYALDKREYAEAINGERFSADHFLDQRAYVVARGREFYAAFLAHQIVPTENDSYESLLDVASAAWENLTGEALTQLPSVSYFTYSNPGGRERTLSSYLCA